MCDRYASSNNMVVQRKRVLDQLDRATWRSSAKLWSMHVTRRVATWARNFTSGPDSTWKAVPAFARVQCVLPVVTFVSNLLPYRHNSQQHSLSMTCNALTCRYLSKKFGEWYLGTPLQETGDSPTAILTAVVHGALPGVSTRNLQRGTEKTKSTLLNQFNLPIARTRRRC